MNQNLAKIWGDILPLIILVYMALAMNGIIRRKRNFSKIAPPFVKIAVYLGIIIIVILIISDLLKK